MIKDHIVSCPICDKILQRRENTWLYIDKSCNNRHHNLTIRHTESGDLAVIELSVKDLKRQLIKWNFANKTLTIIDLKTTNISKLPWFEPDLYLYEQLIKKLKTYIVFS